MRKEIFELQPLRIQRGWKIDYNNFTEYDLDIHGTTEAFYYLQEDLLQISFQNSKDSPNLIIDLGWYPSGDEAGCYRLVMIKDFDWLNPLESIKTRTKLEVISKIEYWVCFGFFNKYI